MRAITDKLNKSFWTLVLECLETHNFTIPFRHREVISQLSIVFTQIWMDFFLYTRPGSHSFYNTSPLRLTPSSHIPHGNKHRISRFFLHQPVSKRKTRPKEAGSHHRAKKKRSLSLYSSTFRNNPSLALINIKRVGLPFQVKRKFRGNENSCYN